MLGKPRLLSLSLTRLINSIQYEHSCKVLYLKVTLINVTLFDIFDHDMFGIDYHGLANIQAFDQLESA